MIRASADHPVGAVFACADARQRTEFVTDVLQAIEMDPRPIFSDETCTLYDRFESAD